MNNTIKLSTSLANSKKNTTFGFKEISTTFQELQKITSYNAYAVGVFDNGHRKLVNITSVHPLIIFDVDDGLSLDDAKKLLSTSGYETLIVTTASHQKEKYKADGTIEAPKDKFRILINGCNLSLTWDTATIRTSNSIYKNALLKIAEDLKILDFIDKATLDASRQFHPNVTSQLDFYFEGKVYDWGNIIKTATAEIQELQQRKLTSTLNVEYSDDVIHDIEVVLADGTISFASEFRDTPYTTPCYCPNPLHNDSNPSAFIMSNGIGVQCSKDGCFREFVQYQVLEEDTNTDYDVFNENIIHDNLYPITVATDFKNTIWKARGYGAYPDKFLEAHMRITSALNKVKYNNENVLEPEILRLPSPTGSGKSEMLIFHVAQLSKNVDIDELGVLIVTKFKDECDRIAKGINEIAGKDIATAFHSDSGLTIEDLKYIPILITTHASFEIRSKNQYNTNLSQLMYREPIATSRDNFERSLCVIDEALSLIVEEQLTFEEVAELYEMLERILVQEVKLLNYKGIYGELQEDFKFVKWIYEDMKGIALKTKGNTIVPINLTSARITEIASKSGKYKSDFGEMLRMTLPTVRKILTLTDISLSRLKDKHKASKEWDKELQKHFREIINKFEKAFDITDWAFAKEGYCAFFSATDLFPKDKSFVILDATANLDYTLIKEIPKTANSKKTKIAIGFENIRNYKNVTLHYTFTQTGKNSILNPKNNTRFGKFINAIEDIVGKDNETLIVSHKDALVYFESLELQDNYHLANYGNTTGKNEWKDCNVIGLYGLLHKPESYAINRISIVSGNDYATSSEAQEAKIKYELYNLTAEVIQTINRIRTRVVIDEDGNCDKADVFLTLPKGKNGSFMLNKIIEFMPHIQIKEFDFEIQDSREFTGANQKRLVASLDRLCKYGNTVAATTIKNDASINKEQWKGIKKTKDFSQTLLDFYGYKYSEKSNKATFEKVSDGCCTESSLD